MSQGGSAQCSRGWGPTQCRPRIRTDRPWRGSRIVSLARSTADSANTGTLPAAPPSQAGMKRLLIWTVMSTCLLGFVAGAGAQDESAADRADRRAAERAARDQERADRARDRAEEQARRA